MHYSIDNTAWMSPIRPEFKKLMAEFFAIADKPDPEAGNLWAERVFTPEGRLVAGGQEIVGESGQAVPILRSGTICLHDEDSDPQFEEGRMGCDQSSQACGRESLRRRSIWWGHYGSWAYDCHRGIERNRYLHSICGEILD